jgi:digeranylgeranylglycerophospholipid reductase
MKCDVIVVGAGPAGLTAANIIASKGFTVSVLERERQLGVKPCGEAASKRTIEEAVVSSTQEFIMQEIKCATIYAPNGQNISIEREAGEGYIINKTLFLQSLAEKAAETGAHIRIHQAVVHMQRDDASVTVETKEGAWEARLILGADGFASTVARKLGFETPGARRLIPCIQYNMVNCRLTNTHTTEFYLGRTVAPLGYAWIFPKGDGKANVGLGVRGTPARPYLDHFIRDHPSIFAHAEIVGIEAAPVTISGLLEKIVDDRVMLVGEAAGQVIPLTGGGIHSSMVGGTMAGETAVKALDEENLTRGRLMRYQEHYNKHWGKRISDSLKALRVLERLSDEDLNELASIIEPQDVLDLANGIDIARVASKFLRHPMFSLKIAKALLTA